MNVCVALCFDKGYANQAAVTIFSSFLNCSLPLKIYCVIPETDKEYIEPILLLESRFKIDITILYVDSRSFEKWNACKHLNSNQHFSYVNYLRLLIPDLIDERKVLYLDSDLLIRADIADLYNIDLGFGLIGGVIDEYSGSEIDMLDLIHRDRYINSGVLLLNNKALRNEKFFDKCLKIYNKYSDKLNYVDQCLINKTYDGEQFLIDRPWNFQVRSDIPVPEHLQSYLSKAKIIHFVGSTKPWHRWAMPEQKKLWWSYASILNLNDFLIIEPNNINEYLSYCRSLELEGDFKHSSEIKSQIINRLSEFIDASI